MSANICGLKVVGRAELETYVAFCGMARAAPDPLGGYADVGLQIELPVVVEVVAHLCRSAEARSKAGTLTLARGEVERSTYATVEQPIAVEAVGTAAEGQHIEEIVALDGCTLPIVFAKHLNGACREASTPTADGVCPLSVVGREVRCEFTA